MDAHRELVDAAIGGDREAAAALLPVRHHDVVGIWPNDRLAELVAARPDLLDEIIRRRPGEVQQG